MVFSSLPAYLDASNWHQQQHQSHQANGSSGVNPQPHSHPHHLPLPPPPPPPPPPLPSQHGPVGGGGTIRPGSMAERARIANIPMPETALKCPRCESTNTKFCYFNNYNLSQPRHFCKTCRRYWTRGGALRSVPVGGGCRRNKRSKSSSSNKSDQQTTTSASGGSVTNNSSSINIMGSSTGSATGTTAEILGLTTQLPPLGFMTPLHHPHYHHQQGEFSSNEIGLSYGGLSAQPLGGITGDLGFHLGGGSSGGGNGNVNSLLSAAGAGGMEQWRTQQFPYFGNLDLQTGLYPTYESGGESSLVLSKTLTSGVTSQLASVKMEDSNNNNQVLNLSRQMVGIQGNEQFWSTSGSAWTDLSGFSSSSTSNNNAI